MRVEKGKTSFSSNSFTFNERRVARVRCCLRVFHHRARDILRVRRVCVVCARDPGAVFEAAEAVEAAASVTQHEERTGSNTLNTNPAS